MSQAPILSIAVPTYNMEQWLEKNLATYCDPALEGRIEVLVLNNASEDSSGEIIKRFAERYPNIITAVDRNSRGYGSSINDAMSLARSKYFRIVDADDWVNTQELIKLVNELETCEADVVSTDYQIVNMQDGSMTPVRASDKGAEYGKTYTDFNIPTQTLPSIHNTTYKTELLRRSGFYMQDKMFFVDEEYVILPYLYANDIVYYPYDIYRYQVANPAQSTSPKNRAKYYEHREKVLKRLIGEYLETERQNGGHPALKYCRTRIEKGIGDHFTTLYMYIENRKEGRKLAAEWKEYVQRTAPELLQAVKRKATYLSLLNRFGVSLAQYESLKKTLLRGER